MILLSALLGIAPTYYYYISALFLVVFAFIMFFRESRRRFFVALKRKPQNVPLVMITCCFIWYSFNLSLVSFTTTRLQADTGLMGFVIMLLSILAIVCCMNAYPYRKSTKRPMLILTFVMVGIIMTCDILYLSTIADKLTAGNVEASAVPKVIQTRSLLTVHIVMEGITAIQMATLPVYRKWIRKIKTSIEVEENAEMEAIDISGE